MDVDRTMFNWRKYVYPLIHTLLAPPFGGMVSIKTPLPTKQKLCPNQSAKYIATNVIFTVGIKVI